MDEQAINQLLRQVKSGGLPIEDAVQQLRHLPFEDLGFAKVDHHRAIRCGFPEVIYCEGKTTEQVVAIVKSRLKNGGNILATRAAPEVARAVKRSHRKSRYNQIARTITIRQPAAEPAGSVDDSFVAIVCAGTSDLPVAEEARETCEIMDQPTRQYYDVGVAGIHRLLAHTSELAEAKVVVVCAGMEGALASVVGGLVSCPVVAVPTSIGYGASFNGLAPLLTMLNSCASGVSVVNIDNGFGAGYSAVLICRAGQQTATRCVKPPARKKASRGKKKARKKRSKS
jgi:hypothetical protein